MFQNRDILSGYMSASSDPETYGQITLLQLPPDTQELGPQQVQSRFVGTPIVSEQLGLLARNGQSAVINGNLLTLPVAGGLLYVEPVYIQRANEDSSYPQLARVLVSYNGRVGFAPDLASALDQVFGAGAAADVPTVPGTTAPPGDTAVPGTDGAATPELATAAASIQTAITNLRAAQQGGDFAAQGTALAALDAAVQQFQAAQAASGG